MSNGGGHTRHRPREILRHEDGQGCVILRCYDVRPDDWRFLLHARQTATRKSATRIDLVTNWTAGLQNPR